MLESLAIVDTEIGVLPSYWRVQRFDSLFAVQQGKQVSKANRVGTNPRPFLRTKNVLWGKLDLQELDLMHFSEADAKRLSLVPDDLLICEGGDIGRTAIWDGSIADCYYQNHLHRARLMDPSCGAVQFMLYWLWYAFDVGNVYFGRGNVTTIPNLSQSRLRELPIPVPPLEEQRKIAAVLSLVQRAIEKQERLIALTTELKRSLMHKLFTEGLHGEPQKETEIGPVPANWDVVPFGNHLSEAQYGTSAKGGVEGAYPVLRMTNQQDGRIILDRLQYSDLTEDDGKRFRLLPGDILFNRTNSADLVGRTAIFDHEGEFVFASYLIRLRTNSVSLRSQYLNHYFNWTATQSRLKSIATRGVSQSNISASNLKAFTIPLPSIPEQEGIVTCLNEVDSKRGLHASQVRLLTDLFRTLLHQLMTAQIRVDNLDLCESQEIVDANSLGAARTVSPGVAGESAGTTERSPNELAYAVTVEQK